MSQIGGLLDSGWTFAGLGIGAGVAEPDIPEGIQRVIVACSGGVDSMVLSDVLYRLSKAKKKFQLAICHMDFGLRGKESDLDFVFVEGWARRRKIPCFVRHIDPNSASQSGPSGKSAPAVGTGESRQEWARRLRYEWFRELASDPAHPETLVALGHNENDVAENVLFRLARGTSAGRMAGMKPLEGAIWRPMLRLPREAVAAYAKARKLKWREDSSNAGRAYTRNVIRHDVLPILEKLAPGATGRIAACGREAADVSAWARTALRERFLRGDGLTIGRDDLLSVPRGAAFEAIGVLIDMARPGTQGAPPAGVSGVDRVILNALVDAVSARTKAEFPVAGGVTLRARPDGIVALPAPNHGKPGRSRQYARLWRLPDLPALIEDGGRVGRNR